jgi:glycerol uptake facilitator protein
MGDKRSILGHKALRSFLGEFTGTYMMCFFGIGAVAGATLFSAFNGPLQVGLVWGLAITLSIYVTRHLSCAHFNPAVSFAMCLSGRMRWRELPLYVLSQCAGAFCAAGSLWLIFADSVKGSLESLAIGMDVKGAALAIWAEPFPNTANGVFSPLVAAAAEALGVFVLVMVIFSLTEKCNTGGPENSMTPLFIGLAVTMIICIVGPITDAGLNPARDFMPRLVAMLAGWGSLALSIEDVLVYVAAPLIGAGFAALYFTKVIEHVHLKADECCGDDE